MATEAIPNIVFTINVGTAAFWAFIKMLDLLCPVY